MRTVGKTQCTQCTRYFVGVTSFDTHQTLDKSAARSRVVCMTDEGLRQAGLETERRLVRFWVEGVSVTEEHDVWFDPVGRDRIAARFSADDQDDETEDQE